MTLVQKISMFWLVLLGGLFAHAILGLMPLVYASGAAKAAADLPLAVLWQLSIVFSLPLLLATLTATTAAR